LLASDHHWFDSGSRLYRAANLLLERLPFDETSRPQFVGEVVACDLTDGSYYSVAFEGIPGMLYAMAVECWLKGLLIAQVPRKRHSIERTRKDELAEYAREVFGDGDISRFGALLEELEAAQNWFESIQATI
jgi:hypothetical protein